MSSGLLAPPRWRAQVSLINLPPSGQAHRQIALVRGAEQPGPIMYSCGNATRASRPRALVVAGGLAVDGA